ncbi:MAG: mannonate dehydratase [bacterium]|nr:mannonate dehydratase [bacterium]
MPCRQTICPTVRSFGLEPIATGLSLSRDIITGGPARDDDMARFLASVRVVAEAGIGVITVNFTALRASEGYGSHHQGRGGAHVRDFDAARQSRLLLLPEGGQHTHDDLWHHLTSLLKQAVPVARTVGVRLAMHPNDPPVPVFRGVAQPLCDLATMRRLVETVDDPANSIYFDSGVATEWGEDAVAVARWFASRDRIGIAHIRNVRVERPRTRYTESFIDDGDADIAAVIRVLQECGYTGGINPDHTPACTMDGEEMWIG